MVKLMNNHLVILVPIDFTPAHTEVLEFASELASQTGASLLLLHVVQYRDPMRQRPPEILTAPLEDCARSIIGVPEARISYLALEGDPVRRILETAELYHCKTIVMGRGGNAAIPGQVAVGVKNEFRGIVHWVERPTRVSEDSPRSPVTAGERSLPWQAIVRPEVIV